MEDDRDQEAWLGPMLRQPPAPASDACIDAETLAAWAEGALDQQRTSAVELHASNCSRCMAMLAAIERTTPAAEPPAPAWAIGPFLRWMVPLTAAATAIAIWVLVPDRPVTQIQPSSAREEAAAPVQEAPLREPSLGQEQSGAIKSEPAPGVPSPQAPSQEPGVVAPEMADSRLEKRADADLARQNAPASEEDKRRERAALDALGARAATLRDQTYAPPVPPSAAPAAPSVSAAPGAANESALALGQQQTLAQGIPSSESTSPANPLIRWRVMAFATVERSVDGGNNWIKTAVPPGVAPNYSPALTLVAIRAVDSIRAVVRTSDGTELYTTNGGVTWERVQGNATAPF